MRQAKDMSKLRELPRFRKVLQQNHAELKDYSMQSVVQLSWDLNEEAIRDQMFKIKINNEEAILDVEELMHYLRVV